ncbi:MAG: hypothetical protein EGR49_08805 [Prevotella sp.]|nr:hypothetical protein [Prevotella sp.]
MQRYKEYSEGRIFLLFFSVLRGKQPRKQRVAGKRIAKIVENNRYNNNGSIVGTHKKNNLNNMYIK